MRACTKCGVVKARDAFPPVRRGEPKLQTWCRACFAEYGKQYYRKNHETQKRRLLWNTGARRAENRRKTVEYLRSHACMDCGMTDIVALQFDHLRDKKTDVTRLVNSGATWKSIEREIAKCVVRCANCHRLETARRYAAKSTRSTRQILRPEQLALTDGTQRICRVSGFTKPFSSFPYRSREAATRHWICLSCQREVTRAWYLRRAPTARRVSGYGLK